MKRSAPKAATPAVVSAFVASLQKSSRSAAASSVASSFLAFTDAELERLRGILVERGAYADQFKTLFDKATQSVADAKADIAELERLRALVSSGQAQPDTGGTVSTRSIQSD